MESTKTKQNGTISKTISNTKNKEKIKTVSVAILIVFIISLIVAKPSVCISSVYSGLYIWATSILPSLFPFMFFTKFLTSLDVFGGITHKFKRVMHVLFKAPAISAYIFVLSVISGYPMGAKLISEFYDAHKISAKQANKLATFCSTSGPLFLIGSVGTAMFLDKKIGYVIFASHVFSSILNGIIFRNCFVDDGDCTFESPNQKSLDEILPETMKNSILSALVVGGYIAISFLCIDLLNSFGILNPLSIFFESLFGKIGIDDKSANAIVCGLIEMSKGCLLISKSTLSTKLSASFASFFVSFGGICTFFQAMTFLSKCGINKKFYIFQKLVHGILSFATTFVILLAF